MEFWDAAVEITRTVFGKTPKDTSRKLKLSRKFIERGMTIIRVGGKLYEVTVKEMGITYMNPELPANGGIDKG